MQCDLGSSNFKFRMIIGARSVRMQAIPPLLFAHQISRRLDIWLPQSSPGLGHLTILGAFALKVTGNMISLIPRPSKHLGKKAS